MIFTNEMSFKAKMRQIAKQKKLTPQQVQQNYLIEQFLIHLAHSNYSPNFIIKGGVLIGNLIGLGSRTTMDHDTTVKGFILTKEHLRTIIQEILGVPTEDSFQLRLLSINDIRETDEYAGYRIKISATFGKIHEFISLDVTTGDKVTPSEMKYPYRTLFENQTLTLYSYNIETILAEKLETIMSRREANSRPRDYYDIYILNKLFSTDISRSLLKKAFFNTANQRNSTQLMSDVPIVISSILNSTFQQELWSKYRKQYTYAHDLEFSTVLQSINNLLTTLLA
jgi:predicted nucleotidyltransferase component of viral defense system